MKQILFLIFFLSLGEVTAQNLLPLPKNPEPGREYWRQIEYDSAHRTSKSEVIPAFGWEECVIEKMPKHQRFRLELPVFDTITLKISVDKSTHMANLPDEYGLITDKTKIEEGSFGWRKVKKYKADCLSAHIDNCIYLVFIEIPPKYKKIQRLVLKSTAHQQYYENLDTMTFKQVIELKPLVKVAVEVPPQYITIFKKKNPYATYSEWREMICAVCGRTSDTALKIQKALKERGYYHGYLDNIIGDKTKAAVLNFQKKNDLELGSLNAETLDALGIENEDEY